jgi:hypothetical protein
MRSVETSSSLLPVVDLLSCKVLKLASNTWVPLLTFLLAEQLDDRRVIQGSTLEGDAEQL